MIPYTRRESIFQLLSQKEIAYIEDFIKLLPGASESTIRRDLRDLAKEGRIVLLRGGAAKMKEGSLFDLPLELKLSQNMKAKERIARFGASLIKDGEVVFLDSSTTVLPMVKFLKDRQVTIVTASTHIPNRIKGPDIKCIILGGEVIPEYGSIVGSITENLLSSMFFDRAFFGANGFSINGGVNSPHYTEAAKMKLVQRNSKITYMMLDASKKGISTLYKVFDLSECNIITDEYSEMLKEFKSYVVVPAGPDEERGADPHE